MSRWTKHLLAVVVVASLVVGAVAGRALAQAGPGDEQARPRQEEFLNRVAAGLGVPVEERKEAIQYAELEMLDEAIEEGGPARGRRTPAPARRGGATASAPAATTPPDAGGARGLSLGAPRSG